MQWWSPGLLVLRLAKRQGLRDGIWAAIEGDLDDIGNIICCEVALLCAVGLHKEKRGLCNANGIGHQHQCSLAQATLTMDSYFLK